MMDNGEMVLRLLISLLPAAAAARLGWLWIKELKLYASRNRDFDEDSGGGRLGLGVDGGAPAIEMSSKCRVTFGYPIFTVACLACTAAVLVVTPG